MDIIQDHRLASTLAPGTVTYEDSNSTSCIDLCFVTENLVDRTIKSRVDEEIDHHSDHLPITTILDLRGAPAQPNPTRNWKATDKKKLQSTLDQHPPEIRRPRTKAGLDQYVKDIVSAIITAIEESTPMRCLSPKSKAG